MSSTKVDAVLVYDPIVDIHKKKAYAVVRGGQNSSYQTFAATNLSSNQVNLSCNPPSMSTMVDRRVYLQAKYTLTFTGTNGGSGNMLKDGFDAPRSYPLNRSIQTLSTTLNNDSYSVVQNQVLDPMLKFQDRPYDRSHIPTTTPNYEDQYQEFNDWQRGSFLGGGSARNALGGYGESTSDSHRGSFTGMRIISNTATTAVVELIVTEMIMMSPFAWGPNSEKEPAMIGLQNMSISLTFGDLPSALWSHNDGDATGGRITTLSATVDSFSALFHYITPPMEMAMDLPKTTIYPYYEVVPYNNTAITVQPGASATSVLNSVQLKSIPKKCYLVAVEDYGQTIGVQGLVKTNTFANISNVNITFNNKSGLLSSMTEQQLYEMSVKNGSKQSWSQWNREQGSIMALDFASDLSLDADVCPGKSGNFQFQVQCTIKNPRPTGTGGDTFNAQTAGRAVNYVLRLITVSEGVMIIHDGSVSHQIGVIDDKDLAEAKQVYGYTYDASASVYGGELQYRGAGLWDWIKRGAKKLFGIAKDKKLISKGLEFIPGVGPIAAQVARSIGLGKGGVRAGKKAKKAKGSGMMSRAELRSRLGGAGGADEFDSDEYAY